MNQELEDNFISLINVCNDYELANLFLWNKTFWERFVVDKNSMCLYFDHRPIDGIHELLVITYTFHIYFLILWLLQLCVQKIINLFLTPMLVMMSLIFLMKSIHFYNLIDLTNEQSNNIMNSLD